METVLSSFQQNMANIGEETRNRPVYFKVIRSASKLLLLEAGSQQSWNRYSSTEMVSQKSMCIPSICLDSQSTEKSRGGESPFSNNSNSNLADPKLVPRTLTSFSEKPNHFATKGRLTKGSSKPIASSYPKSNNATSSMGCFRKRLAEEGLSERASDLMVSSRREGTLPNYSSAWNKWVSWCAEQNVDPVRCNVNWILDFLVFLFESGYEYRTICTYRSAISALHNNIEGRPVGEHPQVSSLITGVFNNRPPQPKYNFIWDVQLVLDYLKKELPNNNDLSDKRLIFKVAMLLGLTSASRVRGLHILDTRFMVRTAQKYVFKFHKLHKSWRQGQNPATLEFAAFSQDKDLCVVSALDEYLNRTEEWRRVNNETQLLLSYIQPHKQVVPSTISGWLKNVLKASGINVSLFTAHSTRSATTSKASASGLSVIEILERGTWSSKSTWQRFYKKDIIPIRVEHFQNRVMEGT